MPLNASRSFRVFLASDKNAYKRKPSYGNESLHQDPKAQPKEAILENEIPNQPRIIYDNQGLVTLNVQVYSTPGAPLQIHFAIWEAPLFPYIDESNYGEEFCDIRVELSIDGEIMDIAHIQGDEIDQMDVPFGIVFTGKRTGIYTEKPFTFTSFNHSEYAPALSKFHNVSTFFKEHSQPENSSIDILVTLGKLNKTKIRKGRTYRSSPISNDDEYESSTLEDFGGYAWETQQKDKLANIALSEEVDWKIVNHKIERFKRSYWPAEVMNQAYQRRVAASTRNKAVQDDIKTPKVKHTSEKRLSALSDQLGLNVQTPAVDDSVVGSRSVPFRLVWCKHPKAKKGEGVVLLESKIDTPIKGETALISYLRSLDDTPLPRTPRRMPVIRYSSTLETPCPTRAEDDESGPDVPNMSGIKAVPKSNTPYKQQYTTRAVTLMAKSVQTSKQTDWGFQCFSDICRIHYDVGQ